ncbi:hypothetical protein BU23DRAFT_523527 [Bimuria novae-zelandiae CBS 107.79]|uniref:Uncharacterized protein n=1 Tax=Bimuria novae-zelandiae CBS 107.79 TaxID=1447943 RepID=A0A6A5VTK5_9PLEO|nr:hypothetical protein BU23DRAFT_523527 [Bimuria novae-zelandiae CBS 107.79]
MAISSTPRSTYCFSSDDQRQPQSYNRSMRSPGPCLSADPARLSAPLQVYRLCSVQPWRWIFLAHRIRDSRIRCQTVALGPQCRLVPLLHQITSHHRKRGFDGCHLRPGHLGREDRDPGSGMEVPTPKRSCGNQLNMIYQVLKRVGLKHYLSILCLSPVTI